MLMFTGFLEVFNGMEEVTNDIILAFIYGGFLLGIGVGLVIKFGEYFADNSLPTSFVDRGIAWQHYYNIFWYRLEKLAASDHEKWR